MKYKTDGNGEGERTRRGKVKRGRKKGRTAVRRRNILKMGKGCKEDLPGGTEKRVLRGGDW